MLTFVHGGSSQLCRYGDVESRMVTNLLTDNGPFRPSQALHASRIFSEAAFPVSEHHANIGGVIDPKVLRLNRFPVFNAMVNLTQIKGH